MRIRQKKINKPVRRDHSDSYLLASLVAFAVTVIGVRVFLHMIARLLILWLIFVAGYIAVLIRGGATLDSQVLQWRSSLLVIQVIIGGLMIVALIAWLRGNENRT